jgi:hypothetical protein
VQTPGNGHDGVMFRHVVMFQWAEGIDEAHVAAASAAFDELPSKIDVLRSYVHGPDAGISEDNYDYVVVADVDSPDDFVTYRDHPDHQALVGEFIAGRVTARSAVQYRVD